MNKTILITGGAGFIGGNLIEYLFGRCQDCNFINYDKLTYAADLTRIPAHIKKSKRYTFVRGDISNKKKISAVIGQSDIVIHLASNTHVNIDLNNMFNYYKAEMIGLENILDALKQHKNKSLIYNSSSQVYGECTQQQVSEENGFKPENQYGIIKAYLDSLVRLYINLYKLKAVILRPVNIYGPKQHIEKFIPRFITNLINNKPILIYGTGQQSKEILYVTDFCRLIEKIIDLNMIGQIYNIGGMTNHRVIDIAKAILRELDLPIKNNIEFIKQPNIINEVSLFDDKVRKELSWQPQVSFDQGIKQTIGWYKKT